MEVCCTRALCKRKSSTKMEYTKEQALAKGGLFGDASKSPKLFSLRPSTLGAFLLAFHSLLPLLEVSGKVTAERSQSRSSLPPSSTGDKGGEERRDADFCLFYKFGEKRERNSPPRNAATEEEKSHPSRGEPSLWGDGKSRVGIQDGKPQKCRGDRTEKKRGKRSAY